MTVKRSAKKPRKGRPGQKKGRQRIAVALLQAISDSKATNAQAARWLGISARTMHDWSHLETAINVEIVLDCPQLEQRFTEALCVHDHGDSI